MSVGVGVNKYCLGESLVKKLKFKKNIDKELLHNNSLDNNLPKQ